MFHYSAGLVNQLMSCYWMDSGLEIQSNKANEESMKETMKKIQTIKKRGKPKFDF